MAESLDRWLDVAMAKYADAPAPLGFEVRTIARLREEKPRRAWVWAGAFATAAALALIAMVGVRVVRVEDMATPRIAETISVPAIAKVEFVSQPPHTVVAPMREDDRRGVPIVAAPITRQEEAVLRVVRNARAKQLASLAAPPKDFTGDSTPLEIQDLNIPTMFGEEKK